MSAATSADEIGVTTKEEVITMDPLLTDLKALLEDRDERYAEAGLLPRRLPRRSSLEIMRDVRRRREQERPAA